MPKQPAANVDWQSKGGVLEIPDGWFVTGANFDIPEPIVHITKEDSVKVYSVPTEERTLRVPKALAYYLSTHFCGSYVMRGRIVEDARNCIRTGIKELLGL